MRPLDQAQRIRLLLALAAIALIALGFRAWRIETLPAGLYADEVHTARNVLAWRSDPHPGWFGVRDLWIHGWGETSNVYLAYASAMMALGSDSVLGIRLISVVPSFLSVALLFWLAWETSGRRVALLASFLLAASHWASRTGRTGWDEVMMTTMQLAALALLARAQRRESSAEGAAAGVAIGLSLYTYLAARLVLLHGLVWQAWEVLVASPRRIAMRRFALLVLTSVIVAGPFYFFMVRDRSGHLTRRSVQLSVFSQPAPWTSLSENITAHLLMFHVRGGSYARDAHPRFPMLDPITGALLLCGIVVFWRNGGWQRRLLLSWFAIAILAGVLSVSSEGPPYPYRVANLAPWACLVAAIGGVWLWDRFAARVRFAAAISAAILIAVLAFNAWVLFVIGPRYPGTLRVYGVAPTRIALWLAESRHGRRAFVHMDALGPIPVAPFPHATANMRSYYRPMDRAFVVQLIAGEDVTIVGGEPASLPRHAVVIVPRRMAGTIHRLAPNARVSAVRLDDGREIATVFETP